MMRVHGELSWLLIAALVALIFFEAGAGSAFGGEERVFRDFLLGGWGLRCGSLGGHACGATLVAGLGGETIGIL